MHVRHALKIQGQLFSICVHPTCVQRKYLHLRLGWQKWMIWDRGRSNVYVNGQPALYEFVWWVLIYAEQCCQLVLFFVYLDATSVQRKYLHLRLGWQKWMIWEGGRGNVYVNEQPALYKFIWYMNWFMLNNDASLSYNIQERKTQNVVFSLTADLTSTVCPSIWRDRGVTGARWRQGGSWTTALQTPNYRSDGKNSCSVLLLASMLLVRVFQLHITYVYYPDITTLVDWA